MPPPFVKLYGTVTLMFVALFSACAETTTPARHALTERRVLDIKELAGTWEGWVAANFPSRITMTIKEDGSYQGASHTGAMSVGRFFLDEGGKLRYQSSRSSGEATLMEDKAKLWLIIVPDGTDAMGMTLSGTGRTELERVAR